jgi:hypothetical protein
MFSRLTNYARVGLPPSCLKCQPFGISTAPLISFSRAVKQVSSNRLMRPQIYHIFLYRL